MNAWIMRYSKGSARVWHTGRPWELGVYFEESTTRSFMRVSLEEVCTPEELGKIAVLRLLPRDTHMPFGFHDTDGEIILYREDV